MFEQLEMMDIRPQPFEFYNAADLWTDEHTSKQMLKFHLDEKLDVSSRNIAFIDQSVDWIVSRFNIGAGKTIADFGCGPGLYTKAGPKTCGGHRHRFLEAVNPIRAGNGNLGETAHSLCQPELSGF